MLHHVLFLMSLSGSIVFILYRITYPLAQRYFPHPWRKSILCLSLFFYLVPVPLFKEFVLSRLKMRFTFQNKNFDISDPLSIDLKYSINTQNGQISFGPETVAVLVFAFCMVVIASVVIIMQLRQYGKNYRTYQLKAFHEATPPELNELLQKVKEESGIKKSVKLICSRLCDTPMTIGIFSPTIVVPVPNRTNLQSNDLPYVLKHELVHIKNWDLLIKFLALFVLAVHWYNPICYLLYRELCIVSELDCDYGVTKDLDDTGRQRYGDLIIDLAVTGHNKKDRFTVGLVNNEATAIERRIVEMKRTRKTHRPILACIAMAVICVMGTITAFAYEAPALLETTEFETLTDYTFTISEQEENIEHFQYDYFFTTNDGKIINLDGSVPLIGCKHDFIEGTITEHHKNSNGSCVTYIRKGYLCTICNYAKPDEIISKTEYTVCPH